MRGFEPRSRHHDSSACSPLHHTGKNSCCHTPETVPSLRSLVAEEVATYILQPVDWLVRPANICPFLRGHRRDTQLKCLTLHTRSIFILSTSQNRHSSLQEVPTLHQPHVAPYATLRISLSPGVREVSSNVVKRWDQGTSASPHTSRLMYHFNTEMQQPTAESLH